MMSLRVAAPLAVTDEAIFSNIPCHCEWSKTAKQSFQAMELLYFPFWKRLLRHFVARNDTKCYKRLLRPPDGVTRNDTKCYKRLLRPPDGVARNDTKCL